VISETVSVREETGRARYYGWKIVGTLSLTETVSWGILFYAFSIFLSPMRDDLGWSSSTLTGAYSLALLVSGLSAPLVGVWLDRHGPRAIMTVGSILGVLMVLAWSRVDSTLAFYLIWFGIGLAMATTLYEPAFTTLAAWFDRDRPRAMLIVTVAAGFASTIFLPLAGWLEESLGWREALLVLAVLLGAVTILPHALVLRRRPEDLGLHPDGQVINRHDGASKAPPTISGVTLRTAMHDPVFWWITAAFFCETFSTIAVSVHLISYLVERGESAAFAATAVGLIGAAQVGARILATALGPRVSQVTLTAIVFALQAVALIVLMEWQTRAGLIISVLLLGAGRGVVTLMRAGLVADFFGRAFFGSISGTMAFFLTGARALAPVGAGIAYGYWGDYRPVLWTLAGISLLGAVAMLGARQQRLHQPAYDFARRT
jgi:sugar phosphate permease